MILASKSPRRKEILSGFGIDVRIDTREIEEVSDKDTIVEKLMDISSKKSLEVAKANPEEYVVSADTAVIFQGEMLGKPKDKDDAYNTLKRLSGKEHQVITAYTITNIKKEIKLNNYETTDVLFKELSEEEINWYIDTGEPMDKAGAYGIQGKGSILVERIEGDFNNVKGFPLSKFYEDLKSLGIMISDIKKI